MISFMVRTSLMTKTIFKDVVFISTIFGLLFFVFLNSRPLSAPDEGRYTEIPREMVASGDYVTPRLNGVKYFEKPPLLYWMGALSIKLFGPKEGAMRFWPAFLSLLGCLMVYGVGQRLYNRRTGIIAAIVLGSCLYYYAHSQIIIIDSTLSFFMSLALFSFLLAHKNQGRASKPFFMVSFFVSMALAVLAKGLIGAVLPGLVILTWAILTRSWSSLLLAFNPWGIVIFFLIAAPWHILVSIKNPEFPYFYFIHEHLLRYTTTVHGRKQFPGFFVPIFLLGWYPWVVFVPHVLKQTFISFRQAFKSESDLFFLCCWIGLIFLFFSFSNSQLIPYIHPIFAPFALILGRYLDQACTDNNVKSIERGLKALITVSWIMALFIPIVLYRFNIPMPWHLKASIGFILALLVLGPLGVYYCFHTRSYKYGFLGLLTFAVTFHAALTCAWPYLEDRSVKPIALYLLAHRKPDERVVCFNRYYQDLPAYLGETVTVVNWQGELEFGIKQEDTSSWMIDEETFWKLWTKEKKMYMVTRKVIFEQLDPQRRQALHLVHETHEDILVTNKE